MGLDCSDDAVPELRPLRSRSHCFIGGSFSARADYLGLQPGIVPPDHIFGTRFRYNEATGEVDSIIRAAAGWGKISVLEELRANLGISHDHIIYMGDGSSDLPVMMHVNQYDGLTIAVSEAKFISRVAKRTVLSANTMSVLVPVLERVMNWNSAEIRRFFGSYGLMLLEWDSMHTDILTIQDSGGKLQRYLMTTPRHLC